MKRNFMGFWRIIRLKPMIHGVLNDNKQSHENNVLSCNCRRD